MKKINIIIVESSDIMADGLAALINGRHEVNVIGKATSHNALTKLLETTPCEIVLLGPILSEKYPNDIRQELKGDFPCARFVEVEFKDEQETIIRKITLAVSK